MKISQKLLLVCGLPMLTFLCISALYLHLWWKQSADLNEMKQNISLFTDVSRLIHETQKERGLTAIYLGSGDKKAVNEQYTLTNNVLDSLQKATAERRLPQAEALQKARNGIDNCRNMVSSPQAAKTVGLYTRCIGDLLQLESAVAKLKDAGFGLQRTMLSAQILEDAKENAGRLRAALSGTTAANKGISQQTLEDMLQFKAGMEASLESNALDLSPDARAKLDTLTQSTAWKQAQDTFRTIMQSAATGGWNLDSRQVFSQMTTVIDALAQISREELQRCQERIDTLSNNASQMQILLSVIVIAALLGISAIVIMMIRSINQPFNTLLTYAERVATGDLDAPAPQGLTDMGALNAAWGSVISKLKTLLAQSDSNTQIAQEESQKARRATQEAEEAKVQAERARAEGMHAAAAQLEEIAQTVNAAVDTLKMHTDRCGEDANNQAARLTETSASMEEMNSTVLDVARNAAHTSEVSAATKEKAANGAQVTHMAIESIQGVRECSLQLKKDMNRLDENARNITNVMAVISEIADQTNLLALNAAIEAARAGEAGRGFAVVADEVRKLAEKTMTSTNEVGQTITAIQKATAESGRQVDIAVTAIEEATQLVNQSGTALQEIVDLADETADQVRAIATAAEEQSATSEEITRAVSDVNDLSQGVCDSMTDAHASVEEVAEQSQKLLRLIHQMRQE